MNLFLKCSLLKPRFPGERIFQISGITAEKLLRSVTGWFLRESPDSLGRACVVDKDHDPDHIDVDLVSLPKISTDGIAPRFHNSSMSVAGLGELVQALPQVTIESQN